MYRRRRGKSSLEKKAQVSMEYLAVIGISLFLIMPMVIIFYERSGSLQDDVNAAQLEKIGLDIIDAAEEAYYLGPPTQKSLDINLPQGIQAVTIGAEDVTFDYTTLQGTSSLSLTSKLPLNMSGTINTHPGPQTLIIKAHKNGISINESST